MQRLRVRPVIRLERNQYPLEEFERRISSPSLICSPRKGRIALKFFKFSVIKIEPNSFLLISTRKIAHYSGASQGASGPCLPPGCFIVSLSVFFSEHFTVSPRAGGRPCSGASILPLVVVELNAQAFKTVLSSEAASQCREALKVAARA